KGMVQSLLRGLCDGVQSSPRARRGRKPIAFSDAAYAMTMKVYTTFSGRRATKDIADCAKDGQRFRLGRWTAVVSAVHMSRKTIRRFRAGGRVHPYMARNVAAVLGMPIADLRAGKALATGACPNCGLPCG